MLLLDPDELQLVIPADQSAIIRDGHGHLIAIVLRDFCKDKEVLAWVNSVIEVDVSIKRSVRVSILTHVRTHISQIWPTEGGSRETRMRGLHSWIPLGPMVGLGSQHSFEEAFPRVHQWPEHGYVICLCSFLPADAGCAPERGAKGVRHMVA